MKKKIAVSVIVGLDPTIQRSLSIQSACGGLDSGSRIKYGTSFAEMTVIDWPSIFV
jgi:hypothetical protein